MHRIHSLTVLERDRSLDPCQLLSIQNSHFYDKNLEKIIKNSKDSVSLNKSQKRPFKITTRVSTVKTKPVWTSERTGVKKDSANSPVKKRAKILWKVSPISPGPQGSSREQVKRGIKLAWFSSLALYRGSSHADMFITLVPETRAMRYTRRTLRVMLASISFVRFHVTGDTMPRYVSSSIFHSPSTWRTCGFVSSKRKCMHFLEVNVRSIDPPRKDRSHTYEYFLDSFRIAILVRAVKNRSRCNDGSFVIIATNKSHGPRIV